MIFQLRSASAKCRSCNCLLLQPIPTEPANLQLSFTVAAAGSNLRRVCRLQTAAAARARAAGILKKRNRKRNLYF
ncbi:hypothetical protein [Methanimicrococcus hongohii]|uniref:hypothetical protein n=1 Tax=Methanimicrococcus hongohii TaxID=3028295 RepID=UPI002930B39A|nr:hypothetical protein [Methanimicrococcus sp. Hf6]